MTEKLIRFVLEGDVFFGGLEDDGIRHLGGKPFPRHLRLEDVRLVSPCLPTKVVAVGLNYLDHAKEVNMPVPEEPLLFIKPSSSVIGPDEVIVLPPESSRVDYEAELAIVIGRTATRISRADARDYILGYTCLNDVTARDLQGRDGQWTRAKGFDTFCPLGPWIATQFIPDDAGIELYLNGELKQRSRTSNLIFDPYRLVEFISSAMTLYPGDVIATGTTSGIGPMKAGDSVEVRIEGIGSLVNTVESYRA